MIAAFVSVVIAAVYLYGVATYRRRFPNRRFSAYRVAAFLAGDALPACVLLPAFDRAAEASFAAHMAQHIVMWLVAPPLMLLGAPLLLLVTGLPPRRARALTAFAGSAFGQALFSPLTAWLVYVFVLWGAHFSLLYELALEHPAVHVLEHLLFLAVSFLFWGAVIQIGYAPRPVTYPIRMFFLFFAIPQGAFLGFALGASQHVLYPEYSRHFSDAAATLADQHAGADMMWIAGGFILFVAFMSTAAAWAADERRPFDKLRMTA